MNYLELIVTFHRWKEVNPLPASAIALWYELVAICNKAGWPEDFTVPNAVLQANAGLSRKEFDRARQMLIEFDLVNYKKSNRVNNAGKYKVVSRLCKRDNVKGNTKDNERDNVKGNTKDNFKDLKDLNQNTNENKKKYGEFVSMMESEYQKLVDQHGSNFAEACIVELDNYKGSSGKTYKSDYRAILKWVIEKVRLKRGQGNNSRTFSDLEGDEDE